MRITEKMLELQVQRLNRDAGFPGKVGYSTIGAYVLDYAYGGVALHRYTNERGGIEDILGGHCPKRELFNLIRAYALGIRVGEEG